MQSEGNLFDGVPLHADEEAFTELFASLRVRIERIVSTGQASPETTWFDQTWNEWVIVLAGEAVIAFEGEHEHKRLRPGDYVFIPPHRRHRVAWTDPGRPTVWLAVHFDAEPPSSASGQARTSPPAESAHADG